MYGSPYLCIDPCKPQCGLMRSKLHSLVNVMTVLLTSRNPAKLWTVDSALNGAGCAIIATSTSSKTFALIMSILPPSPSSHGQLKKWYQVRLKKHIALNKSESSLIHSYLERFPGFPIIVSEVIIILSISRF